MPKKYNPHSEKVDVNVNRKMLVYSCSLERDKGSAGSIPLTWQKPLISQLDQTRLSGVCCVNAIYSSKNISIDMTVPLLSSRPELRSHYKILNAFLTPYSAMKNTLGAESSDETYRYMLCLHFQVNADSTVDLLARMIDANDRLCRVEVQGSAQTVMEYGYMRDLKICFRSASSEKTGYSVLLKGLAADEYTVTGIWQLRATQDKDIEQSGRFVAHAEAIAVKPARLAD